jgi:hypothetical protein
MNTVWMGIDFVFPIWCECFWNTKKEDLVYPNISISGLFLSYFSSMNRGVAKSGYDGATAAVYWW